MSKLYAKAIKQFGEEAQLRQATEECAELIQAITKVQRYGSRVRRIDNLIEELADVQIMMEQVMQMYNLESLVSEVKREKLQRLRKRLK